MFVVWIGEMLYGNDKWILKGIGGILWLAGFLYGGVMGYTALGRLAWRTRIFGFLRPFFPPQ